MRGLSAKSNGLPTERCCARSHEGSIDTSSRRGLVAVGFVAYRRQLGIVA